MKPRTKLISGMPLLVISSLLLVGCSTSTGADIPNNVSIAKENPETGEVITEDITSEEPQVIFPDSSTEGIALSPSDAKTPADFGLSDPKMSDDPVQALTLLANNSIYAMSYLGSYESYYDQKDNSDVVLAFDPKNNGEQVAIRYTDKKTGEVQIFAPSQTAEPNKSKWLAAYQALFLAGSTESVTVTVFEDNIDVAMATASYKYYFKDGVIVLLVGTYIAEPERLLEWTIEYRNGAEVKDLVEKVN